MGIIHDIITVFTVYQLQSPFTALFSKEFMKTGKVSAHESM